MMRIFTLMVTFGALWWVPSPKTRQTPLPLAFSVERVDESSDPFVARLRLQLTNDDSTAHRLIVPLEWPAPALLLISVEDQDGRALPLQAPPGGPSGVPTRWAVELPPHGFVGADLFVPLTDQGKGPRFVLHPAVPYRMIIAVRVIDAETGRGSQLLEDTIPVRIP